MSLPAESTARLRVLSAEALAHSTDTLRSFPGSSLRLEDQTDLYCSATVSSPTRVAMSSRDVLSVSMRLGQREVWESAHWFSLKIEQRRRGGQAATEPVCIPHSPHKQKGDRLGHERQT